MTMTRKKIQQLLPLPAPMMNLLWTHYSGCCSACLDVCLSVCMGVCGKCGLLFFLTVAFLETRICQLNCCDELAWCEMYITWGY